MCPINTIDDNLTLNSAGNTIEQNDHMSFLVYPEEDEVTYMIPVPKGGTPRDTSLTPITIMIVNSIGLKKSQAILKVLLGGELISTFKNVKISNPFNFAQTWNLGSSS